MTDPEIIPPADKPSRPAEFTDEIFDAICEQMTEGKGLRKICEQPDMPSRQTFLRWIAKDTAREAKYTLAREALMDWYAEEILEIAWDSSKDTIPATKGKAERCNTEWVQRSRLKVDTIKFLMAKLHPKRYGDKLPEQGAAAGAAEKEKREYVVRWQRDDERDEEDGSVASLMRTIDGRTRTIERVIVTPIWDDNDNLITTNDPAKLRARIIQLEERLGTREGKPKPPEPPKQITYDPGPLPARVDPEILVSMVEMIKRTVPRADQRPPEEVLSEVLATCEEALQAKYGGEHRDEFGRVYTDDINDPAYVDPEGRQ